VDEELLFCIAIGAAAASGWLAVTEGSRTEKAVVRGAWALLLAFDTFCMAACIHLLFRRAF
jgi:hypothetical protein